MTATITWGVIWAFAALFGFQLTVGLFGFIGGVLASAIKKVWPVAVFSIGGIVLGIGVVILAIVQVILHIIALVQILS